MRHSVLAIAAIFATLTQASAQTPTEMLEHIDDLGRTNEKLQERVKSLENDNKALRERLKQLGAGEPSPASVAPQPVPTTAAPRIGAQGPASRTLPLPSPVGIAAVSHNGTIDLDSDPQGAQAATSLGSGCETPCAMEISADAPFTVTFTHPGYAPAAVNIRIQPGQPGVSDPQFSPPGVRPACAASQEEAGNIGPAKAWSGAVSVGDPESSLHGNIPPLDSCL